MTHPIEAQIFRTRVLGGLAKLSDDKQDAIRILRENILITEGFALNPSSRGPIGSFDSFEDCYMMELDVLECILAEYEAAP